MKTVRLESLRLQPRSPTVRRRSPARIGRLMARMPLTRRPDAA